MFVSGHAESASRRWFVSSAIGWPATPIYIPQENASRRKTPCPTRAFCKRCAD
jgi:hypothetical protein